MQPSTAYDFYVRAVCSSNSPNDASSYSKYTYSTTESCPKPLNLNSVLMVGSYNSGTAKYLCSWSGMATAESYTVCVVGEGGQPSATGSNAFITSSTSVSYSNMFCNWKAFYVRANCANGEASAWSGPHYL